MDDKTGNKDDQEHVHPSHLPGEIRHSPEMIRELFRNGT